MVRAEHASRTSGENEPRPKTAVIYAGGSQRRENFINWAFAGPNCVVSSRPGGEEDESRGVVAIARQKIYSAYAGILKEGIIPNESLSIVGADIQSRIGTSRVSRSKPETPEEIRRKLAWLSESAAPYFTVDAGSGIKIGKNKPVMNHDQVVIILDPGKISQLSSPQGFEKYQADVEKYDILPDGTPINITDIAEGLSLPALVSNGAVLKIYRREKSHEKDQDLSLTFRQRVKQAIYFTGVGISPEVLKRIHPNIDSRIETWPWLEKATARSLGEAA